MKTYCNVLKAIFVVALCFLLAVPVDAAVRRQVQSPGKAKEIRKKNMKNSFQTPDFAYPQDVVRNAGAEYDKALKAQDGLNALRAAIQMNIAETSVDAEGDAGASIRRYNELGQSLAAPWNSMAWLLSAKLYTDIYQNDSWKFIQRKLPLDKFPENVQEWSADMFALKTLEDVHNAIDGLEGVGPMSVREVTGLLENVDGAEQAGMTVGDFVRLYGAELLSAYCSSSSDQPLRFGDGQQTVSPQEQCTAFRNEIYDNGMRQADAAGNLAMASMFAYEEYQTIAYVPLKNKFLDTCYGKYSGSEWGARFVAAYAQSVMADRNSDGQLKNDDEQNADRRKALQLLEEYNKKFPEAPGGQSIPEILSELRKRDVRIAVKDKALPGTDIECTLTVANVYDFKLLIYRLPDRIQNYVKLSELASEGKLVRTVPVSVKGSAPDQLHDTITLQGLKPGNYAILPSTDGTYAGMIRDRNDRYEGKNLFQVTDMTYFRSNDQNGASLFIVDAATQQPLAGVKVHMEEKTYRGKTNTWDKVTDGDGRVEIPANNVTFRAVRGESYVSNDVYNWANSRQNERFSYIGRILTDLSIYKPGQEVGFVGILGLKGGHQLEEVKRQKVQFTLYDANNKKVDTLDVFTDDRGRASGHFTLPTDGLLGSYRIAMQAKGTHGADQDMDAVWINVADYKSPTFRVETEKIGSHFALGDTLDVVGKALTYAGMPVAGGKVAYKVTYSPWRFWWWFDSSRSAEFTGETQTDAEGKFNILLPTETIRGTSYEKGVFTLTVTVTNEAGESREADPVRFSFASAYAIDANIPNMICADGDARTGSVKVSDITGYPVDRTIYYTVRNDKGDIVQRGECSPGKFPLDVDKLASGHYSLLLALNPEMKSGMESPTVNAETVVWRTTDRKPAVRMPVWMPVREFTAKAGQKTVKVPVGSGYDGSYLYCRIDDGDKLLSGEWIKVSDGIVNVDVQAPDSTGRMFLHVVGTHDFETMEEMATIVPEVQIEKVEITTESFRDRMTPGDMETWKFRFTIGDRPMVQRPVMAVMSNQALNALSPFQWCLDIYGALSWRSIVDINHPRRGLCYNDFTQYVRGGHNDRAMFAIPGIYTYGYPLYMEHVMYDLLYCARPMAMDAAVEESAPQRRSRAAGYKMMAKNEAKSLGTEANGMDFEEVEAEDIAADAAGDAGPQEREELRPVEMPLAFFMPDLLTDGDGVATVNFMVPNFNGTWQFQIAGYTSDLKGAVQTLDVVAAKQVMVQMNAPRFLRTGDKAQVSATLYNNSEAQLPVYGRIEILTSDGRVLKAHEFTAEELKPSGQRTVTIDYDVPADVSEVQIRAYAVGGKHKDGEGVTVAVLPSSTPVIDSKTFYAEPGAQTIKVDLPKNAKDATVTLQYCGNPVWECVTALPSILAPESVSILSQVNALYGNAIAQGLIRNYPQLAQALKTFAAPENAGDSTLVSNLQKNQQLKAVTLNNTPWVNSAESETRRMQSLVEYLDTAKSQAAIDKIMKVLRERQNNDGGWSWCPDMPTSSYITGRVQLHMAMLQGMGYLPQGAEEMVLKSFGYTDREFAEAWEKSRRKYFSLTGMLNYLYVKSFFADAKDDKSFEPLRKVALKAIEEQWKDFGIYDKATAVTLEYRLGKRALAASILESLRQYAKVTPGKGMCFENLKGVFSGWNPLITTAQVLEAYGEAAPQDPAVDQLRQWLLMSKQTQDWGDMNGTSEVVQAILSTRSDWTVASDVAKVTVAGKEMEIPARAKLTDSFTVTLTPAQVRNGDIRIQKNSAGPAWGGVMSQYVAPILDVKSEGVPQLKVEKNVYSIEDGKAVAGSLKVGDRVRVTLTVTTDRDMDYVAVIDNRSACLEPVDQLSGYAASDGVWMYREVRDTQTNLFIPFLRKGTSVISYECFVDRAGEYTLGIAQAQSQYAPVISAHSAGVKLTVQ